MSDYLKETLARIEFVRHGVGADQPTIAAAESRLGVDLPRSYRRFLGELGWLQADHVEVFGLGADTPRHLDFVENTLQERERFEPRMPPKLVALMNDGGGSHYCLDTGRIADDECPVVFWDHEAGRTQEPELVAQDFESWLGGKLTAIAGD